MKEIKSDLQNKNKEDYEPIAPNPIHAGKVSQFKIKSNLEVLLKKY
jgi:hypothetical protein